MNSEVLLEMMSRFQQKRSNQEQKNVPSFVTSQVERSPAETSLVHKISSVYHQHPEWNPPKFVFKARPVPRHALAWAKQPPKPKALHITVVKPFSFHERDKDIEKKKSERFQKIIEEEQKLRVYRARPVPSWVKSYRLSSPELQKLRSHYCRRTKPAVAKMAAKSTNENVIAIRNMENSKTQISEQDKKRSQTVTLIRSKAEHNILSSKAELPQSTLSKSTATPTPSAPVLNNSTVTVTKSTGNKSDQKRVPANKQKSMNNLQQYELKKKPPRARPFHREKVIAGPTSLKVESRTAKSVKPGNKARVSAKPEILSARAASDEILEDLMGKPSSEDMAALESQPPPVPKNSVENLKTIVLDADAKVDIKTEEKKIDYDHLLESVSKFRQKLAFHPTAEPLVKPRAKLIRKPFVHSQSPNERDLKLAPLKRRGSYISDTTDSSV